MEQLKQLFNFNGRINRGKFFLYSLIANISNTLSLYIMNLFENTIIYMILFLAIFLIYFLFSIINIIKRFHDLDRPGWQTLLLLIPFVSIYIGFILIFKPGTDGDNQYGSDPLA